MYKLKNNYHYFLKKHMTNAVLVEIKSYDTILQGVISKYDPEFLNVRIYSYTDGIEPNKICKNPLFSAIDVYDYIKKEKTNATRFYKKFNKKEIIKENVNTKGNRIYNMNLLTIYGLIKCIGLSSDNIPLRELVYSMIEHISDYSKEDLNNYIINPTFINMNSPEIQEELKQENDNKNPVVYFINESGTDNIKIGYTNNIESRLSTLQTGNSNELIIVKTIDCASIDSAFKLEYIYHELYKKNHIRGEWFNIPNFIENCNI